MPLTIHWVKLNTGQWPGFDTVNLAGVDTVGVYIIWMRGKVVRVGQGRVADRLLAHRQDPLVTQFRPHGLYVTWASVPAHYLDGVERYLANHYNPMVGDRFPEVAPIVVNLPA